MTTDIPGTWEPIAADAIPVGARVRRTVIGTWNTADGLDSWESVQFEIFHPDPLSAPARTFWRDPDTDAVYCRTAGDPDSWAFAAIDPGDSDVFEQTYEVVSDD